MRESERREGVICMRREGEATRGGGGEGGSSEAGRRRKRGAARGPKL